MLFIRKYVKWSSVHLFALFYVCSFDMFHASINEICKILVQFMKWYRSAERIFTNAHHLRDYNYSNTINNTQTEKTLSALIISHGVINAIKMQALRTLLLCVRLCVCVAEDSKNTDEGLYSGSNATAVQRCMENVTMVSENAAAMWHRMGPRREHNIKMNSCHCTWLQHKSYIK